MSCKFLWPVLVAGLLASTATQAAPGNQAAYDQAFDSLLARYDLPGLAVGVIENGKVVYQRTAGELAAGSGDKVTADTLFKIASNSKAMTASVLARQVDAGKLRWDDSVVRHLPQFAMFDPWVTKNMQVQDLLVHNSGLPEGGGDLMLWPEPNDYTRADIINGLRYIKPAYSFRAGYAYDNLLYVVAGEVAAAIAGTSYEALVQREVFEPLQLGCRVGEWHQDAADNVAQPHTRVDGRNAVVHADSAIVPAITSAAAGGIRCSLNDMLLWAGNWLAPSAEQGKWLSAEQREAMWTPHTPMPISARSRRWNDTHYYAYALGFRTADVDGAWTVSHTGTLMGMYSVMYLLPDSGSGFVMLTNGQGSDARTVMSQVLLKQLTGKGSGATVQRYADEIDAERAAAPPTSRAPDTSSRVAARAGDAGLQTGVWRDPWFGDASICERDGVVRFTAAKSPLLRGTVMRVDDRLLVDWDDDSVDAEAWLDFAAAPAVRLTMAKVDPQADFSFDYEDLEFTRSGACR